MGDRTSVTLYFLASQKEKVDAILEDLGEEPQTQDVTAEDGQKLCAYYYDEVNYGTLEFLPELRAAGIAHESAWDSGGDFDEGDEYCRFTKEGGCLIKTVIESERSISIEIMMTMIHQPNALVDYIKARNEELNVLPWTNQAEYGPTYQAMQLISR